MSEEDINFLISIQDLEQPEFDNACLKRENKLLKEENDILCSIANGEKEKIDKILELINRISKAIEYIENEMPCLWEVDDVWEDINGNYQHNYKEYDTQILLNKLKGVDKE